MLESPAPTLFLYDKYVSVLVVELLLECEQSACAMWTERTRNVDRAHAIATKYSRSNADPYNVNHLTVALNIRIFLFRRVPYDIISRTYSANRAQTIGTVHGPNVRLLAVRLVGTRSVLVARGAVRRASLCRTDARNAILKPGNSNHALHVN
jgi:hypothetical protein